MVSTDPDMIATWPDHPSLNHGARRAGPNHNFFSLGRTDPKRDAE
jgi:hypothetical protein